MFGGTPSNLAMSFLAGEKVEVVTRVNLPMLIKLAGLTAQTGLLGAARDIREHARNAIWVAPDPVLLPLLIGCGLTEFSMTPGALPMARAVIEETSAAEIARIAARVLTLGTVDEIEQYLLDTFGRQSVYDGAHS